MKTISSNFDWFFKFRIYHIPFWFVYHYLWWTFAIGSPWDAAHNILSSAYSIKYCFYVVLQAAGVYFNLYFLIPRFLEKGRYALYIGFLMFTIVATAVLIVPGYYVSAWLSVKTFYELYEIEPARYEHFFRANTFPSTVTSMMLAMSVKLTKNWVQSRRREQALETEKHALEKEKLETELKFLKSQFNPHFLFNTINSIFVLIDKDPNLASESLAKFSDILRYQLYECNEHQIPLRQEMGYLENFIELQKLRQDHGNVKIKTETELTQTGDLGIAPFILTPFVENAFKHVSRDRLESNWIHIHVTLNGLELCANIANSTSASANSSSEFIRHSGIGLKNVRRRLDLLYPDKYALDIARNETSFQVMLKLTLTERKTMEMAALDEHAAQALIN
ncbi:histidine kinase [Dyadobacter sp. CY326]|nr:histidine kinase [Dyadobacter sp. CY326]MCE7064087.1 histidine kinase [Dyadobacter sp. CY326]